MKKRITSLHVRSRLPDISRDYGTCSYIAKWDDGSFINTAFSDDPHKWCYLKDPFVFQQRNEREWFHLNADMKCRPLLLYMYCVHDTGADHKFYFVNFAAATRYERECYKPDALIKIIRVGTS